MKSFEDFISDVQIIKKIEEIAKRFEGYTQDSYNSLLPNAIEKLIKNWLRNFELFQDIDFNIVLRILDNLKMVKDQEIRNLFLQVINQKILPQFNATLNDIYICPLGEEYESSFRLSAFFNNKEEVPHYKSNINSILKAISKKSDAVIVFFDDFLFSGGQLVCIFKKLLGIKLAPDDTDDIYSERITIENPNLLQEFKKHKIALYYHLSFQSGYENEKFNSFIKENGLSVEIFLGNIEKEDVGCFGTLQDITLIEGKSNESFHSGVFTNFKPSEVKPIYELLKEIGEQLLRNEHAESKKWNNSTYKQHSLGYGAKAKLIMGEQNVPTSTLTALWLPSLGNKNKKIKVRDKEVFWEALFYRKSKKPESESTHQNNEIIYPKILVNKIHSDIHFVDPYNYDLITLISLNRLNFLYIFGHGLCEKTKLVNHLNDIEQELFEKRPPEIIFNKRVWYSFNINSNNKNEIISELNQKLYSNIFQTVGLVFELNDIHNTSWALKNLVSNIFINYPTRYISIIIDCTTRNIDQLKQVQSLLQTDKTIDIFISNQISVEEISMEREYSFFENINCSENIICYLNKCLAKKPESEVTKIQKSLQSFKIVEVDLSRFSSIQIDKFSPKGFITDFEKIFEKPEINFEDWLQFFNELISICDTFTPEFIEYFIYYSAGSCNDYIRFSTLKFSINLGKTYLIDSWVEGSNCIKKNFENIFQFIEVPIPHLIYPILRYYARHKNTVGVRENILQLISEDLAGKYLDDYYLAKKILSGNANKYSTELLSNNSVIIMKLLECGVDIFEEVDTSILKNKLISDEMMGKILLSTKMSTKKINVIYENYQYLILTS